MTTRRNRRSDFPASDHTEDPFSDLYGPPTTQQQMDRLGEILRGDPFATTHVEDGEEAVFGVHEVMRFERASAAFIAACGEREPDDDKTEILRLIAAYWLKKSRAIWLDG